jgi:DNA mismatch repair protein MutS2
VTVQRQRAEAPQASRSRGKAVDSEAGATSGGEINVIGRRVEEATELVDKFIDDAALAGRPSVRIIHGYGTGALRRGLAEFLSAHPLVERIRHEAEDRGGQAVTIADLHV